MTLGNRKSKHGSYDAREYPINETGHLDSSHLANIGRFGRSYQHSPLEHAERRVVALEQKVRGDALANKNQNPPSTKQ